VPPTSWSIAFCPRLTVTHGLVIEMFDTVSLLGCCATRCDAWHVNKFSSLTVAIRTSTTQATLRSAHSVLVQT